MANKELKNESTAATSDAVPPRYPHKDEWYAWLDVLEAAEQVGLRDAPELENVRQLCEKHRQANRQFFYEHEIFK